MYICVYLYVVLEVKPCFGTFISYFFRFWSILDQNAPTCCPCGRKIKKNMRKTTCCNKNKHKTLNKKYSPETYSF